MKRNARWNSEIHWVSYLHIRYSNFCSTISCTGFNFLLPCQTVGRNLWRYIEMGQGDFYNHFISESSKRWETISNNGRNPSEKNRAFCLCIIKTGLMYEMLVTRLSEIKRNANLCKAKWKLLGETNYSCSVVSTSNRKHIYLYRF